MITIKYPSTKDRNNTDLNLRRQDKNSNIFVKKVTDLYLEKEPKINTIEIETINRCNNDCSFCPVNRHDEKRPYKMMKEELFHSIIDQLSDMNYSGYISLFSNNEPLIDKRILDFVKYAKENLPNAIHAMYTNGILLDEEKYQKLVQYLDYLVIDNYNDDLLLLPNIQKIVDEHKNDKICCKISVLVRKKNQILLNRGGSAPNRENKNIFHSSCTLPFMQLIVRPDGKVSRCCQDALAKTTLGDLSRESITELWKNNLYTDFRSELNEKGRSNIEFCKECDSFGIGNYFPEYWTGVVVDVLVDIILKMKQSGKKIYLFENNKQTRKVDNILKNHGIRHDGVVSDCDYNTINSDESFTIFGDYNYEILDKMDVNLAYLGKRYLIYEDVIGSLHTDFIDENENKDIKEIVKLLKIVNEKKVIVFGTGFSAVKVADVFDFDVAYYIDNNKKKEGTEFNGREVWNPTKLKDEEKENICVVIASIRFNEMKKQLLEENLCLEENILEGLKFLD